MGSWRIVEAIDVREGTLRIEDTYVEGAVGRLGHVTLLCKRYGLRCSFHAPLGLRGNLMSNYTSILRFYIHTRSKPSKPVLSNRQPSRRLKMKAAMGRMEDRTENKAVPPASPILRQDSWATFGPRANK